MGLTILGRTTCTNFYIEVRFEFNAIFTMFLSLYILQILSTSIYFFILFFILNFSAQKKKYRLKYSKYYEKSKSIY